MSVSLQACEDPYMIEVGLPEDQAIPEITRSFTACMPSVTETPVAEVPQPRADLPGAVAHWRSWLAGQGAGLVTVAKPAAFNWPGYWPAVLGQPGPRASADGARAVLMFGTPSGIVLSPQDPSLLGRVATDLSVREGYVFSGLDPASLAHASALPHLSGTVEAIALAERATGDMHTFNRANALANRGLDGDRYAAKAGTFTPAYDTARGYDLTLIEAEVLDSLTLPEGRVLGRAEVRRNIITRRIDLNAGRATVPGWRRQMPGAAPLRAVLAPRKPHHQRGAPRTDPPRGPRRRCS